MGLCLCMLIIPKNVIGSKSKMHQGNVWSKVAERSRVLWPGSGGQQFKYCRYPLLNSVFFHSGFSVYLQKNEQWGYNPWTMGIVTHEPWGYINPRYHGLQPWIYMEYIIQYYLSSRDEAIFVFIEAAPELDSNLGYLVLELLSARSNHSAIPLGWDNC